MHCLIIFTRYPEAGKTKTRLIPVLGAIGAAEFQRQMTEYTSMEARSLLSNGLVKIAVYFTGGSKESIGQWLGEDLFYQDQGVGDLGERMSNAFANAFLQGMERVIIIGTDCPEISPEILKQGFAALSQQDLVLGPCADGGYYLIGLRALHPELFIDINWGTATVCKSTVAAARKIGLSYSFLPLLHDIDLPEDLEQFSDKIQKLYKKQARR